MIDRILLCAACLLPFFALAQHQPVFPDMEGEELIQQIRNAYKPAAVLSFADARDTLFARVYARNDTLACVYSGHRIYLDPTQDPTVYAYQDGALWGINTEHTWPQAYGAAGGNPRADMHHLYPTRIAVNSARDNRPFAEIPDQQTSEWYYLTQVQFSIPTQNIDLYSEKIQSAFEPREDHKGNVARAMFYFYTMYKSEADAANPAYFEAQRATLCQWHFQDPVDDLEWERSWQIAHYQDGKPNPFVLDCTLPERTYCQDAGLNCTPVSTREEKSGPSFLKQNFPNPFHSDTVIEYELDRSYDASLTLHDVFGRNLATLVNCRQSAGTHRIPLDREQLPPSFRGLLICRLQLSDGERSYSESHKMVVIPD